jgi:STE24 endopeptidase
VALPGMLLVQRLTEGIQAGGRSPGPGARLGRSSRDRVAATGLAGTPAVVPALALSLAIVSFAGQIAGNLLSRQVEARADTFALELTREPAALVALQRSLAIRNVSDPDPPALLHELFGTHPTTVQRIGLGLEWARER